MAVEESKEQIEESKNSKENGLVRAFNSEAGPLSVMLDFLHNNLRNRANLRSVNKELYRTLSSNPETSWYKRILEDIGPDLFTLMKHIESSKLDQLENFEQIYNELSRIAENIRGTFNFDMDRFNSLIFEYSISKMLHHIRANSAFYAKQVTGVESLQKVVWQDFIHALSWSENHKISKNSLTVSELFRTNDVAGQRFLDGVYGTYDKESRESLCEVFRGNNPSIAKCLLWGLSTSNFVDLCSHMNLGLLNKGVKKLFEERLSMLNTSDFVRAYSRTDILKEAADTFQGTKELPPFLNHALSLNAGMFDPLSFYHFMQAEYVPPEFKMSVFNHYRSPNNGAAIFRQEVPNAVDFKSLAVEYILMNYGRLMSFETRPCFGELFDCEQRREQELLAVFPPHRLFSQLLQKCWEDPDFFHLLNSHPQSLLHFSTHSIRSYLDDNPSVRNELQALKNRDLEQKADVCPDGIVDKLLGSRAGKFSGGASRNNMPEHRRELPLEQGIELMPLPYSRKQ